MRFYPIAIVNLLKVKMAAAAFISVKAFFPRPVCGLTISRIEKVLRVANWIFYKTVSVSVFLISNGKLTKWPRTLNWLKIVQEFVF